MSDKQVVKKVWNRAVLLHVLCWIVVIMLPIMLYRPGESWETRLIHFARNSGSSLSLLILFYINYLWLIPRYYFANRRGLFYGLNVLAVLACMGITLGWWQLVSSLLADPLQAMDSPHKHRGPGPGGPRPHNMGMLFQGVIMQVLVVFAALSLRATQRVHRSEEARREAEKARTDAELRNLRNQLNPHFLLNTLNNIYALVAFDPAKAQEAIEHLSKLLRHVLYDNQQNFVPLYKEVAFLQNYIDLMKIRVTQDVEITTHIAVSPDDATPIAPLIFISLIENAFKHGISPTGKGNIAINIGCDEHGVVTCHITNSNHPKTAADKSGSGVGLAQVQQRLDLMYPDRYTWHKGVSDDGTQYHSTITIHTR